MKMLVCQTLGLLALYCADRWPVQPAVDEDAPYNEAMELAEEFDDDGWAQLPVVDDLEVAALAAEAAMEAVTFEEKKLARAKDSSSEVCT